MLPSYLRVIRQVPFEEAGVAYQHFSSLPEANFQLVNNNQTGEVEMLCRAYLDQDGVVQANISYVNQEDVDPVTLIASRTNVTCPRVVESPFNEIYLNSYDFSLPKVSPFLLHHLAFLFTRETGREARVAGGKLIITTNPIDRIGDIVTTSSTTSNSVLNTNNANTTVINNTVKNDKELINQLLESIYFDLSIGKKYLPFNDSTTATDDYFLFAKRLWTFV